MEENPDLQQRTAEIVTYVTARIRLLRCERGLTVQQVADSCGMERSNLSRLEAGRSNPTLRTLCTLCLTLDSFRLRAENSQMQRPRLHCRISEQ
jgi:transcriptional regulator with XRE-family HTH domain